MVFIDCILDFLSLKYLDIYVFVYIYICSSIKKDVFFFFINNWIGNWGIVIKKVLSRNVYMYILLFL